MIKIRYYIDSITGLPHINNHDVAESEVEEVLLSPGEDRPGKDGSRVAIGCTFAGRYLKVVYVNDYNDGIFVITAYELRGKPLAAYRRRKRRKR